MSATGMISSIDTSDPTVVVVHFDPTIPASKFKSAGGDLLIEDGFGPGVDLVFAGNLLQNGEDAVALYIGDAAGFPNGTAVTTAPR